MKKLMFILLCCGWKISYCQTYLRADALNANHVVENNLEAYYFKNTQHLRKIKPFFDSGFIYNGESAYILRPSKIALVYLHGLYGNAFQFIGLGERFKQYGLQHSHLWITLPGHSVESKVPENLKPTYVQWIEAVKQTLLMAKKFSEKVIIVGQSTGGLLGVYMSLHYPELVDGLILVEPALKVRDYLALPLCSLKSVFKDAGKLDFLLSRKTENYVSTAAGCEVVKLSNKLLNQAQGSEGRIANLARMMTIPVMVINNEEDKIVSSRVNKKFYNSLPKNKRHYYRLQDYKNKKHGMWEVFEGDRGESETDLDKFSELVCSYLVINFNDGDCRYFIKEHVGEMLLTHSQDLGVWRRLLEKSAKESKYLFEAFFHMLPKEDKSAARESVKSLLNYRKKLLSYSSSDSLRMWLSAIEDESSYYGKSFAELLSTLFSIEYE